MRMSNRYGLNLVEGSDIVNPLVQDVPNYERIDEEMGKNADAGVPLATELLTGTVHALTRENPNAPMFRFVATANYKSGDTFTVDGVQVTALLTTGEPLATGCYVINSNVLCCLVGTVLTMFCANSLAEVHAVDSDKLGGKEPSYYAPADSVVEAISLSQNANQISLTNRNDINNVIDTLSIESGTLTLNGSEHCAITNFNGFYYKIGKIVYVNIEFTISNNGGTGDISVNCLPYATRKSSFFTLGYTNVVFKEPTNNKVFVPCYAGAWRDSKNLLLGGSLDGRNWTLHGASIVQTGAVNISGCYEIAG